jgi:DNA polymerase III subunit delta'
MMTRLADIAGHGQTLRVLRRALAEGRLHHSLLLHGPEAVGKRTTALALAAALNCLEGGRAEDGCGRCASCLKVGKGIHPDVAYVTLEKTVISIDAIRALRHEAAAKPFEGRRRVFVVDPADRMSPDAQNALLKTLEEPAPATFIFLITARPMHLLPTTRSRCQSHAFGTLPPGDLAERIALARGLPADEALRAARLAGGRFGAALDLDLAAQDAMRDEILGVLGRLAERRPRDHVAEDIEVFGSETEEIAERLEVLAGLVRDMMVLAAGAPEKEAIHAGLASELRALSSRLCGRSEAPEAAQELAAIMERVGLARSDLERHVNRRLLLETLLFDIAAGAHAVPAGGRPAPET